MKFYVGLHQPCDAYHFRRCCISVNRLRSRKSDFEVGEWIMDSGAFTEITTHGRYRHSPAHYARQIRRWRLCGKLVAAVSQDYMCEPFVLQKTGLTVKEHQRLTIERYDALLDCAPPAYILPVLQGFKPSEYVRHVWAYGDRLAENAWVGVGSVCKRNSTDPKQILEVLDAIHEDRPDLRLHGFGIKLTALREEKVRDHLYSADSMAWSFAARIEGRDANDWREARNFCERIRQLGRPI